MSSVLAGLLFQITGFVVVWIIVDRFNQIGGWTLPEMTFLYGMRLTSHGIFYLCFSQLFELDRVLITGEFDRFLVRPLSPLLQIFTRKLRVNCFGDLIGGIALLIASAARGVDIDWTPLAMVFLVLAVFGGALVEGVDPGDDGRALVPVPEPARGAGDDQRGLQPVRQLPAADFPDRAAVLR